MSESKTVSLPYIKSGERFKLEVCADKILISRFLDKSMSGFPSQNRVECSAEIYYDIIIRYAVNENFTIELRIEDGDVDDFCDFFLNTFCIYLPAPPVTRRPSPLPVIYPKPTKITEDDLIRRMKKKYFKYGVFKDK